MKPLSLLFPILVVLTSGLILIADAQTVTSQDRDIGAVSAAGRASNNGSGGFTVTGSGEDIWGTADEFHYAYFQVTGDVEIIARVTGIDFTDGWAKAGLMARATLDANSPNFMVFFTPAHYSGVQWRFRPGETSSYVGGSPVQYPYWLKLTRSAFTYVGYMSADGVNWTEIGAANLDLGSTFYLGLAVTSHKDGTLCTANFDNVSYKSNIGGGGPEPIQPTNLRAAASPSNSIFLTWSDNAQNETGYRLERSLNGSDFDTFIALPPGSTQTYDTGLTPNTHYWYRVVATNSFGDSPPSNVADATATPDGGPPPSAGFEGQDIGGPGAQGSWGQNQDLFSIKGAGRDIFGTSDSFFFVYIPLDGDFEFLGRITEMDNTNPWAKAGFMARETLNAASRNFFVFRNPASDAGVQYRTTQGGNTTYIPGGKYEQWFKLVRNGDTFSAYRSADKVTWTLIGSTTIFLPTTLYVGMAVTSHADPTLCNAIFDHVDFTGSSGGGGGGGTNGVPAAPTDLRAEGYSGPPAISLFWTDNATNESNYRIDRSLDGQTFNTVAVLAADSTSYYDTNVTYSTHYWYRVIAINAAGASPPATIDMTTSSNSGSSGWQHQDIGSVSAAGNFSQSGNTYTVGGSGFDIWGSSDEFHYAYQTATGNLQIVARITGMANTSPWAKAGIMIRQSVDAGAPNVLLALTPSHGLDFQWRSTTGGQSSYIDGGAASAPVWVKLVQTADTVTGYRSADGNNWTQVASVTINVSSSSMLVGLAVTSHNDGTVCIANFDNVTITSSGGGGGGSPGVPAAPTGLTATATSSNQISLAWHDNATNETGFILERSTNGTSFTQIRTFAANTQSAVDAVAPGSHYWYRVAATNSAGVSPYSNVAEVTSPGGGGGGGSGGLPSGWADQDVGPVAMAGSASYNQGTFTVKGDGADIWGSVDAFHYVYMDFGGNGQLVARVTAIGNTDPWAKAGLMFRQSTLADSANALVMVTGDHGTGLQARSVDGGSSSYVPGPFWTEPLWLKLTKQGTTLTGYSSLDGSNWTTIGSFDLPQSNPTGFPPLFLIGLAVTSHNTSALNTSMFDNVTFTPLP